jgi:ABC-2 type transport system ATP-binding protein
MTGTAAIETEHLRKEFGGRVAVADLSLRVERGELFGFLGPNGAGKTTSIKMLLGLVAPTSGRAWLLGRPIADHRVRARVGFLPEHFRFHEWQTGGEFLAFHAALHGMARPRARARADELLDLVGLAAHREKRLRFYSKGMLQRIGLAQALLAGPDIVFLDEPTSGLDPGGRRLVREILRELSARGTTVFLNSHLLSEIERICHRVAFVRQGEVVRVGTLASFADGAIAVEARVRGLTPALAAGLAAWATDVRLEEDVLRFSIEGEENLPAIHRYLVERGVEVFSFRPATPSLEEIFLRVVGASGDGGEEA